MFLKAIDEIDHIDDYGEIMEAATNNLQVATENVLMNIKEAQDKQKKNFDEKQKRKMEKLEELHVGDNVLLYDSSRKRKKHGGLLPTFKGVYQISKVSKFGTFTLAQNGLDLPGSHKREKLRKYNFGNTT